MPEDPAMGCEVVDIQRLFFRRGANRYPLVLRRIFRCRVSRVSRRVRDPLRRLDGMRRTSDHSTIGSDGSASPRFRLGCYAMPLSRDRETARWQVEDNDRIFHRSMRRLRIHDMSWSRWKRGYSGIGQARKSRCGMRHGKVRGAAGCEDESAPAPSSAYRRRRAQE